MSGVIWITGLSGAGKTTLGEHVAARLRGAQAFGDRTVVHVDGDRMREVFGNDLGHTVAERRENAWRISRTCLFLAKEGCFVVCSTVSMFQEIWAYNRSHMSPYLEVLLAVPVDVLRERDTKGLYRAGVLNVAGIDQAVTWPKTPDLVLSSDRREDLARNTDLLVERAHQMLFREKVRRTA
jgi:cytidine diphosphoramidate kinase